MPLKITAPTRIDLAGGTLDIWPIYLMLPGSVTINLAINIFATVTIQTRRDKRITLRSIDGGEEVTALSLERLENVESLPLIVNAIRYFSPKSGLEITTHARSPQGAGIAGSSTLLIALLVGLARVTQKRIPTDRLIQLARDLEGQVIKVPPGVQDFFPALKGGVHAIHLEPGAVRGERIPISISELGKRIVLCYTGQPRNSGINNWEVTKKFIDGDSKVHTHLSHISDIASRMRDALIKKKYSAIGPLIAQEWENRLALAPTITTPLIDSLLKKGREAGALGGKVCGAGGGGCVILFCDPKNHEKVSQAVASSGAELLPFQPVSRGVRIEVTRS